MSCNRDAVLRELRRSGAPTPTAEIALRLKTRSSNVSQSLRTLARLGAVHRVRRGLWALPKTTDAGAIQRQIARVEQALAELKATVSE